MMEGASVYEVQRAMEELAEATGRAAKTARRAAEEAEEAEEEEAEAEEGRDAGARNSSRDDSRNSSERASSSALSTLERDLRACEDALLIMADEDDARAAAARAAGGVDGSRGDGVRRIGAVGRRVSKARCDGGRWRLKLIFYRRWWTPRRVRKGDGARARRDERARRARGRRAEERRESSRRRRRVSRCSSRQNREVATPSRESSRATRRRRRRGGGEQGENRAKSMDRGWSESARDGRARTNVTARRSAGDGTPMTADARRSDCATTEVARCRCRHPPRGPFRRRAREEAREVEREASSNENWNRPTRVPDAPRFRSSSPSPSPSPRRRARGGVLVARGEARARRRRGGGRKCPSCANDATETDSTTESRARAGTIAAGMAGGAAAEG